MNAPNFNLGSDRPPPLPSVREDQRELAAAYSRDLAPLGANASALEAHAMTYRALFFKYLGLVLKHRWVVLAIGVGSIATGFATTYATTPLYRATAIIQIDRDVAKIVK